MDSLITAAARALAAGDPDRGPVTDVECERHKSLAAIQLQCIAQVDVAGRHDHAIAARQRSLGRGVSKPLDAPAMN
jgi:hypothetical protein